MPELRNIVRKFRPEITILILELFKTVCHVFINELIEKDNAF